MKEDWVAITEASQLRPGAVKIVHCIHCGKDEVFFLIQRPLEAPLNMWKCVGHCPTGPGYDPDIIVFDHCIREGRLFQLGDLPEATEDQKTTRPLETVS